jgi:hypothetical protein
MHPPQQGKPKEPYTLCPLYEHEGDPLPFLYINGIVHPYTLSEQFPLTRRRFNDERPVNVDAMYDTGNAITRICGDLVGFKVEPGDDEPCILTFTYLPFPYGANDIA